MDQALRADRCVGIDVAKDTLEVAFGPQGKVQRFANDEEGFGLLADALERFGPQRIVMEATGGYERGVLAHLLARSLPALSVNPRQVRDFARSLGILAKTDRIDARVLARFGSALPVINQRPSDELLESLRGIVARRRQLIAMRTEELNRQKMARDERIARSIRRVIRTLEQQIADLDDESDKIIRSSEHFARTEAILRSVKGVGEHTARALICELPELGSLSRQEVAALAGLAPMNNDSGQFRGRRAIRGGRKAVRTALYMATLVASRANPTVRAWYQALIKRGKPKKLALTACMRKLLTALNSLVRGNRLWTQHTPVGG